MATQGKRLLDSVIGIHDPRVIGRPWPRSFALAPLHAMLFSNPLNSVKMVHRGFGWAASEPDLLSKGSYLSFAPIALFAYKRPDHLRQTVTALRACPEASHTQLYVFSDGARGSEDRSAVEAVRRLIKGIDGFAEVKLIAQKANRGLASLIVDGVGSVIEGHGRVIVVEDDLVVSPFFLRYMNEALDLYAGDERVASVHGYVFPVKGKLPETFFLRGADCWGWGTWARAWRLFEPNGAKLLGELRRRRLTREFDMDAAYPYTKMLEDQIAGNNDSWAIRWHAAAFLANRLTLYPGKSLVQNIGYDASGTHCGVTERYSVTCSDGPICVSRVPLEESAVARARFVRFGRRLQGSLTSRLSNRIRGLIGRILPPIVLRAVRWARDGNHILWR